jgi:hypothetical protein
MDAILGQVYEKQKAFVGDSSVGEGPDGDHQKEIIPIARMMIRQA